MDVFVANDFPPATLRSLNNTRMFKQVIFASDITSADGTTIKASVMSNSAPTKPSPYSWPRCSRPSPDAILLWSQALKTCFLHPHPGNRRLRIPLGPWVCDAPSGWEWWYSHLTSLRYHSHLQRWQEWYHNPSPYRAFRFHLSDSYIPTLPPDATRVSV